MSSTSIAQAHPNEVENLVDNNEPQYARPSHKLSIDDHFAFPDKTGRMNRRSAVGLLR
ncbi:MAG: hypothetical protein ACR2JB_12185 [Bryobacteraceae bacterium]